MDTLLTILLIIFLLVGGYGSIVDSSKRDFHFGTFGGFVMIIIGIILTINLLTK